jgi:hypothetical protein
MIIAMATTPPTTPPAIAPVLVLECGEGFSDCCAAVDCDARVWLVEKLFGLFLIKGASVGSAKPASGIVFVAPSEALLDADISISGLRWLRVSRDKTYSPPTRLYTTDGTL